MSISVADEVMQLFGSRGQEAYFGEEVSILEHSLQTACLARQAGSGDSLTVAALLHDVGHLLHGMPEDIARNGIDGRHEVVGEAWLRSRFDPSVTEPVRLHVDAKRYLCRVDPDYRGRLSLSSIQSLSLQGGPYDDDQVREFESNLWYRDAIALRRWDDMAKVTDLVLPGLETFHNLVNRVSKPNTT
jgi:phosphonate degradation associated HDIG domain protein